MSASNNTEWKPVALEIEGKEYAGSYYVKDAMVTVCYSPSISQRTEKSTYLFGRGEYQTAQALLLEFLD